MKYLMTCLILGYSATTLANEYAPPAAAAPAAPAATAQPQKATPAPTATPAAAATPATKPAAARAGTVARAQFTSDVQDREPVDKLSSLLNDKRQVYFFSEIKDGANSRVTHRWEYQNKTVHELGFDVGGNRWRVYSSVNVQPEQTGEWKVTVLDQNGAVLGTETLKVEAPAPAPAATPAAPGAPAIR